MVNATAGRLSMDGPVSCVIRVQGALDPWWSDRLGGLRIAVAAAGDAPTTSELRGELLDQGALIGVLTALYELGLPLIALSCAADPRHPASSSGSL